MFTFHHHDTITVLKKLLPINPIIVEAGAFNGADTKKMSLTWPQGAIHAFEPMPEIYERLMHNTQDCHNVRCYPYALSNTNGQALFYVSENPKYPGIASQAGSLHQPKERLHVSPLVFPRTTTVNIITLQTWAQQQNINHIDLLWLDTQGHEYEILQAAQPLLCKINFILAEVSFIESYHNQPTMHLLINWMQEQGFEHIASDFDDITKNFFGNVLFTKV